MQTLQGHGLSVLVWQRGCLASAAAGMADTTGKDTLGREEGLSLEEQHGKEQRPERKEDKEQPPELWKLG